jgi:hypothetical protein
MKKKAFVPKDTLLRNAGEQISDITLDARDSPRRANQ